MLTTREWQEIKLRAEGSDLANSDLLLTISLSTERCRTQAHMITSMPRKNRNIALMP